MLIFEEKLFDGASIGVWRLDEELSQLLSFCSKKQKYLSKMEQFLSAQRKREWLAVRVLLKQICGEEKEIAYYPSGKPYLADGSFCISISHTKGYVTVLLHPTRKVGIDIEQKNERVLTVKHKFLNESEIANIANECELEQTLLYWSAKESVYKLLGIEGVNFSEQLQVKPFVLATQGVLNVQALVSTQTTDYTVHYRFFDDAVLSWVIV
jgi:phosphopantetheinyl transferase